MAIAVVASSSRLLPPPTGFFPAASYYRCFWLHFTAAAGFIPWLLARLPPGALPVCLAYLAPTSRLCRNNISTTVARCSRAFATMTGRCQTRLPDRQSFFGLLLPRSPAYAFPVRTGCTGLRAHRTLHFSTYHLPAWHARTPSTRHLTARYFARRTTTSRVCATYVRLRCLATSVTICRLPRDAFTLSTVRVCVRAKPRLSPYSGGRS